MPVRREKKAVLVVLAVLTLAGLGLRVGYALDQPYSPPPDAGAYARIAENLSEHGSFDARPDGRRPTRSSRPAPTPPACRSSRPRVYWLSGGPHLTLVLVLLALIGAAAVPLDLSARPAPLGAARGPGRRRGDRDLPGPAPVPGRCS